MSTSDEVVLPPGTTVGPPRETTQANPQTGAVVQGVNIPITLSNGGTTSIFATYQQVESPGVVQAMILQRVQALSAATAFAG
jgi:hypothetical protein